LQGAAAEAVIQTYINLTTPIEMQMKTTTIVLNLFAKVKTAALAALAVAALASTPALAGDNDKDGDDFKFDSFVRARSRPAF
jgi:hypothetical protein